MVSPPHRSERRSGRCYEFRKELVFPVYSRGKRIITFSTHALSGSGGITGCVGDPRAPVFGGDRVLCNLSFTGGGVAQVTHERIVIYRKRVSIVHYRSYNFGGTITSRNATFARRRIGLLHTCTSDTLLIFSKSDTNVGTTAHAKELFLTRNVPMHITALPRNRSPSSVLHSQNGRTFRRILSNTISLTTFRMESLRTTRRGPSSFSTVTEVARRLLRAFRSYSGTMLHSCLVRRTTSLVKVPVSTLRDSCRRCGGQGSRTGICRGSAPGPRPRRSKLQAPGPRLGSGSRLQAPGSRLGGDSRLQAPGSRLGSGSRLRTTAPRGHCMFQRSTLLTVTSVLVGADASPASRGQSTTLFVRG